MSDIQDILEKIRDSYLSGYEQSVSEFSTNHQKSASEILLQLSNREKLPEPYRLYRIDMGSGDTSPPELVEFNTDTHLNFDTIIFSAGEISASLSPIVWNGVEFKTDMFDSNDDLLSSWAIKWIDPDENGKEDRYGFQGYIHSITHPENIDNKMYFSIDFGSAPVDSFYDLFSVFMKLGIKNVELNSETLLNEN